MKLNELTDNAGARPSKMRVGRGIGSGKGKTAGRGHKGQKSRSGVANNIFRKSYRVVNLERLQAAIDAGQLDPSKPVTEAAISEAGIVKTVRDGIRVLAKGELNAKISLEVTGASKAAVEAIEKAGGKVTITATTQDSSADAPKSGGDAAN